MGFAETESKNAYQGTDDGFEATGEENPVSIDKPLSCLVVAVANLEPNARRVWLACALESAERLQEGAVYGDWTARRDFRSEAQQEAIDAQHYLAADRIGLGR